MAISRYTITNPLMGLDLDRGWRPELKSEDLLKTIPIVIEIISILLEIAGKPSCTFWELNSVGGCLSIEDSVPLHVLLMTEMTLPASALAPLSSRPASKQYACHAECIPWRASRDRADRVRLRHNGFARNTRTHIQQPPANRSAVVLLFVRSAVL